MRNLRLMDSPQTIEVVLTYKIDRNDPVFSTEKVSAEKKDNYYQLTGVPVFAKNLAYGDIVAVELEDDEYHFSRIIKESGHSVVHIVLFQEHSNIISELKQCGCKVNSSIAPLYLVVDIPSLANYHRIKALLQKRHAEGILDYGESCLSELHTVSES